MEVPFYRHALSEAEWEACREVMGGRFLTTGPRTSQFEARLSEFLGVSDSVGLTSCTHALCLALRACGVTSGDEVIVPAMTFVATAGAVADTGATPIICDVDPRTGLLSLAEAERLINGKTRAIVVVHLYGQMMDMKAARGFADSYGLKLIEDSAHCIEGMRDGVRPGQLGDAACFSFYATKNMTCGEGGALASRHPSLCEQVRVQRLHGMSKTALDRYTGPYQHWDVEEFGFKANMNDMQAAILLSQFAAVEDRVSRREALCQSYESAFSEAGVPYPIVEPGAKSARHLFTIWTPVAKRDESLAALQDAGIGVAVNYRSLSQLTVFRKNPDLMPNETPVADEIGGQTISLPLYPGLGDDEVEYVIETVLSIARRW